MSAHTPGPWTFREFHGTPENIELGRKHGIAPVPALTNDGARVVMSGDARIGTVDCQTAFKRGKGHEVACAERDANARLIAAAPDLLNACKLALMGFELNAAIDWSELERAIAKAEGK